MTEDPTLPRRKVLGALGTIGAAGALGGMGTMAFFSDEEEFANNQLVSGEFDLKVDWQQRYFSGQSGEEADDPTTWQPVNAYPDTDDDDVQDPIKSRQEIASNNPQLTEEEVEERFRDQFADLPDDFGRPVIDLDDVKPGDKGEITFSFHLFDNPGLVWFNGELLANAENSLTDPEESDPDEDNTAADAPFGNPNVVGDDNQGELADQIQARLFYDDNCNNQFDTGNQCIQLVVDNTDSMGSPGNNPKDLALVNALETYIQNHLDNNPSDGTLDNGTKMGLTLWQDDGATYLPKSGAGSFGEYAPEPGDPAPPTESPLTTVVDEILGDTSQTAQGIGAGTSQPLVGIQNILDQTLTTGNSDVSAGLDEGAAALGRCSEDDQRTLVLVTNGVNISAPAFTTRLSNHLRVNGGTVDKFIIIGLLVGSASRTILESVETLPGDHEYIQADSVAEIDNAINGPLSGVGSDPDSTLVAETPPSGSASQDTVITQGSLRTVLNSISGPFGFPLDADRGTQIRDCYPASRTSCLALEWELPVDHANELQTDSARFDLGFFAEQCRHNPAANGNGGAGGGGGPDDGTDGDGGTFAISFIAFCAAAGTDPDAINPRITDVNSTDDDGDPTSVDWETDVDLEKVVVYYGSKAGPQVTIYDDPGTTGTATTGDTNGDVMTRDAVVPQDARDPCGLLPGAKLEYVDGEFLEE